MRYALLLFTVVLATSVSCSTPDRDANTSGSGSVGNGAVSSQPSGQVSFVGGYETDPQDTIAPLVEVAGFDDLDLLVTIECSTDLLRNARVTSIAVVE